MLIKGENGGRTMPDRGAEGPYRGSQRTTPVSPLGAYTPGTPETTIAMAATTDHLPLDAKDLCIGLG